MEKFTEILEKIDGWVWGIPLIVLILATGIWLTIRLRLLQVRKLPQALKYMFQNEEGGEGEVTSFGALCTALSATIGTGNIVGVATATGILAGGPGALFWMWIAAFFGMATKYTEGFLAVKYRKIDEKGRVLGGPFYYIENGMGRKWKPLAKMFALFGVLSGLLGIGTFTQVNGIATAVHSFFDPTDANVVSIFGTEYSLSIVITAFVLAFVVGLVVIGGIKRISKVSEVVVPFMAVLYIVAVLTLIIVNIGKLPGAVGLVISSAFGGKAIAGGAVGGTAIFAAMQSGIARGIFSNEAGLGSAPIAAAAAKTKDPVRQGLVTMTGTFIDTIIVCTLTGLAIVMMGSWSDSGLAGVEITTDAFRKGLYFLPERVSAFILMLCLVFFAFTTILGWNYYSEKCLEYLTDGKRAVVKIFRVLYIAAVFLGPYMTVAAVWTMADIFNGLMAIPNVIALLALSGVVARETIARKNSVDTTL